MALLESWFKMWQKDAPDGVMGSLDAGRLWETKSFEKASKPVRRTKAVVLGSRLSLPPNGVIRDNRKKKDSGVK